MLLGFSCYLFCHVTYSHRPLQPDCGHKEMSRISWDLWEPAADCMKPLQCSAQCTHLSIQQCSAIYLYNSAQGAASSGIWLVTVAASMGCPGYPWISLWFQYFRIRRHISPNPATYFDILLNNRTGVQLAGYPYDSKEMPPLGRKEVDKSWNKVVECFKTS